ncbi:MAG TPA: MBL fold metallo-hydrolase [Actinomycetota bacterium]
MIVEGFTTGVFQSNCYIAAAAESDSAVVIDPGQDAAEPLLARLGALGLRCEAVLLTHGHIDHIWNAKQVAEFAGVQAWIHPDDMWLLEDPGAALGRMGFGKLTVDAPEKVAHFADGDVLRYGGLHVTVRHTPGHTPGHCAFLTDGVVFSGDLIFAGSVGRTDLPRGSMEALMDSIRRVVLALPDETTILSGHGAETTVATERTSNPFVVADARGDLPRLLGL